MTSKSSEQIKNIELLNQFDSTEVGDFIIARYTNEGQDEKTNIHPIRPFLVVGKSDEELYCLYCTTKEQDNLEKYFKTKSYDKFSYIDCSRIIIIPYENFKQRINYRLANLSLEKVNDLMLNFPVDYSKIDYNSIYKEKSFAELVKFRKGFYKVIDSNNREYKVIKLNPKNSDEKYYLSMYGENYAYTNIILTLKKNEC